jgi:hypothetical protein
MCVLGWGGGGGWGDQKEELLRFLAVARPLLEHGELQAALEKGAGGGVRSYAHASDCTLDSIETRRRGLGSTIT